MQNNLQSICIVGGGTAGWMAATLLSSALNGNDIKIMLVESPDIATIGVGESTVPSMMEFLRVCQIDLKAFMQATAASFKLGIRFADWTQAGEAFFHPFGAVGQDLQGFDFYQAWLKTTTAANPTRWLDHSPSAVMADNHRFMLRSPQAQHWVLQNYSYALHLDAVLAARYLRDIAIARGVERIEATVDKVIVDDREYIKSLLLTSGNSVSSDFFIDCTGFQARLIEGALGVGYENWSHYLPCDRAVAVQTTNTAAPVPYTLATARDAGWTWKIPLQHRTGNGYVFASDYCSDDEAVNTLVKAVQGELLNEPRIIPFTTGRRQKIWHNNCLALGLASGFLEPLESTAIHLIYKTLIRFIDDFPDRDFDAVCKASFNEKINSDYAEIRDFIILHYCTSGRDDTAFWQWCRKMPIPDSLQTILYRFRMRGQLNHYPGQFFSKDSWFSILEGMRQRPQKCHPLMQGFNLDNLCASLRQSAANIQSTVLQMPLHADYLNKHCAAATNGAAAAGGLSKAFSSAVIPSDH